MIFLPGSDQQMKFFLNSTDIEGKKLLIVGAGTMETARQLLDCKPLEIVIIVEDYDSLITMRYLNDKSGSKNISIKMMEFANTDFRPNSFDIIYSQGSISGSGRNKIVKEIRNILKPGGIFCAGEIVSLKESSPAFIKDIWDSSDLLPLQVETLSQYYEERGFEILDKKDLSYTLKEFYQQSEKMLLKESESLSEEEKSYHKRLLKKISHESNVYLKLGGSEFMGFTALIMRKK